MGSSSHLAHFPFMIRKFLSKGAATAGFIGCSALAPVLFATPSQAQIVTGCAQGGSGGFLLVADLLIPGNGIECYSGDKLYSNFVLTGDGWSTAQPGGSYTLNITDNGGPLQQHTAQFSGAATAIGIGSYGWSYDVTVWTGTELIRGYSSGVDASGVGATFTKTIWTTSPAGSVNTVTQTTGSPTPLTSIAPSTTASFLGSFTLSGTTGNSFSDSLYQSPVNHTVPGPLPLLGAAAAFGYSRTIRRRIKAVS